MASLDDSFRSRACEIFDVDLDSSLFSSKDTEEDYDSDETYCSEVEDRVQNAREDAASGSPRNLSDEAGSYKELWACLVRVNCEPTLDGFASCLKNFKRTTLIRLKLQLEEHLREDKEASRKLQDEREWFKNFKLTDEEKEDSLRRLREISEIPVSSSEQS